MSVPLWVAELAGAFWRAAGMVEPFPRSLRRPLSRSLPITLVYLPRLCVAGAWDWLRANGSICPAQETDRPLRACLVAHRGSGTIFIDGADAEDEQRFSLAHELAHFLRDYWQPRQLASERLGPDALAVLDGQRPPTTDERVLALLARVPLGCHTHLLRRDEHGRYATHDIAVAEAEADRLAYELLAPAVSVLERVRADAAAADSSSVIRLLRKEYGLPTTHAVRYAGLLFPPPPEVDPLLRRLGLVP